MAYNEAQEIAIQHKDGPMMVLAGPGSGKTHVITKRIEYLIKNEKVKPDQILVITFTKYAANEMKKRFQQGNQNLPVTFGTFHGIYYGILKWAYKITSKNILAEDEKYKLLSEVLSNIHMEVEVDMEDEKDFLASVSKGISDIKNEGIPVESYHFEECSNEVFSEIYHSYEQQRIALRKIDFDDMIVECYKLFKTRPDILKLWQEKYQYILIDEFQDINQMQYDTIRLLANPRQNLFIVGDDDQSIYRFRGAKPEIMRDFMKHYPNAKRVTLEINYRSKKSIVNASSRLIQWNEGRYKKVLKTPNEQGETVHIQEVRTPIEESVYILEEVKQLLQQGVKHTDIAVIYRTNLDARAMVSKCIEYGIPFQMRESIPNIYDHFIAQNIMSYMQLANGNHMRKYFVDAMNKPNRYIAREAVNMQKVTFEEMRKFYCDKEWMMDRIDQWDLDLRLMKNMTPYAMIQYLRKSIGYDEYLKEYALYRNMKIEELLDVLQELSELSKEYKTISDWITHVADYTSQLKVQMNSRERNRNGIVFHTMHGSKGLEFDYVYMIACNEGVSPSKKAVLPEEIEEERRMFYVAMTRAKKKLTILYPKEKNEKDMLPSRFINDLLSSV